METPRAQLDESWKDALRIFFKDFMALCWPDAFSEIDWTKGYECLEQEFQALVKKEEVGHRIADRLVKVWRKDGKEKWVLIHVEVQAQPVADFAERMFVYWYRIFDRYAKDTASLAMLIDHSQSWRPQQFTTTLWNTKIQMDYPVFKLLDWQNKQEALKNSDNPFAVVLLAQLSALKSTKHPTGRLMSKVQLTRTLYYKGWDKNRILDLYRCLDAILILPKPLELAYTVEVEAIEEELQVAYITTAERIGIEKGIEMGERSLLKMQLKTKFSQVSESVLQKVERADSPALARWSKRILVAHTLEDVFD